MKILTLLLLMLVAGCSSSDFTRKEEIQTEGGLFIQQVNARVLSTNAWVNRMPNSGGKFFISGELILLPSTKYEFKSLNLERIRIYDGKKLLFDILPFVQTKEVSEQQKTILYSMLNGIEPPPDFKADKVLSAELIFESGSKKLSFYMKNLKVEQVY